MNLKAFVVGLFRGLSMNGELDGVRDAARQDAKLVVGTYLSEFESEAGRLLTERQQRFIGFADDHEVIDGTIDYSDWTKAELVEEADRLGLEFKPSQRKAELVELLTK